jgi:hypothetical protein
MTLQVFIWIGTILVAFGFGYAEGERNQRRHLGNSERI